MGHSFICFLTTALTCDTVPCGDLKVMDYNVKKGREAKVSRLVSYFLILHPIIDYFEFRC